MRIGPKDRLSTAAIPQGDSWVVQLRLASSGAAYARPDDGEAVLTHYARLPTYRDARELLARIQAAGRIDLEHWLWEPRLATRLGRLPLARPQYVPSFPEYRHA